MVEPYNRIGIVRAGSGAFRHLPRIRVSSSGSYDSVMTRIIGAVVVVRAFGRLLVKDAVRVHAVALRPIVLEEDLDGISHLGMHRRAEQPQMLRLTRSFLQTTSR